MDRSAQSGSQSQPLVDEEDGYYHSLPRQTLWSKLSNVLSSLSLRPRPRFLYEPAGTEANYRKVSHSHTLTSRTPSNRTLSFVFRQACLVLPVLILMTFGIIHVLQVLIGRSSLLWDIDTFHDKFLPSWGKPGHYGDGLAHYPTDATRDIIPLPVHSHNDYWRRIPLFEALHYGCIGVEADVWHFDDDLFVGHNTASLTRNRTFRSLYVDPIVTILDKMNPETEFATATKHGVWDTDSEQTLVLLVDLKTDGRDTFPVVERQLEGLREKGYLTYYNGSHVVPGAVTVVGTGNTPFDMVVANSTYRDIFFDAPLDRLSTTSYLTPEVLDSINVESDADGASADDYIDSVAFEPEDTTSSTVPARRGQGNEGLDKDTPASAFNPETSYYASIDFQTAVGFVWRGHLSARQIDILRSQIRGAKQHGLKARYWNTPVWPISLRNHVWHILVREGADMLNADDLKAATRQDWRKLQHDWW